MGAQSIDLPPEQWLFRRLCPELGSVSGSFMLSMQREGLTDQLLRENRNSIPDYLDDEHGNHELNKKTEVAHPGFMA